MNPKNKSNFLTAKKSQVLSGTVIFLILNALFLGIMLIFVSQAGTGADALEKIYSRQIALAADSLRPGTEIQLYLPKLFDMADKNQLKESILAIDYDSCRITVKADAGTGNSYFCFNKLSSVSIDDSNKIIIIKT